MAHEDVEAIRRLFADLCDAVGTGDVAKLEKLLDKDAREFAPGTPVTEGRAVILNGLQRELLTWSYDLRLDCTEVVAESEWGFCTGTFGLRSVCTEPHDIHYTDGKFVAVVRRGAEKAWRLYRICYNSNLPGGGRAEQPNR